MVQENLAPYNERLYQQAKNRWLIGDWNSLCRININTLINHPERAKIAILAAAGRLQTGNEIKGKELVFLAKQWGLSKTIIVKVLNAGALNNLGKVAAIAGNHELAIKYFDESIKIVYNEIETQLFARERFYNERYALGLDSLSHELQIDIRNANSYEKKYKTGKPSVNLSESDLIELLNCEEKESGVNYQLMNFKELIFCHSLWRSGSTYIFKKFRESDAGIWAYQEPLHEVALYASENPSSLEVHISKEGNGFRHPEMEKPYFYELCKVSDSWIGALKKEMILDDYFQVAGECSSFPYFEAIIKAAKGIPFIQECRTSNRIGSLKECFGGFHIYLWRNPWDQWQSFKVDSYFENMLKIIACCTNAPPFLKYIAESAGIKYVRANDFYEELKLVHRLQLTPTQSYLMFYSIWWLALKEALSSADYIVNIDRLSSSKKYRKEFSNKLKECCDVDIDFSDCNAPQATYLKSDINFFSVIEVDFIDILRKFGGYDNDIKRIDDLKKSMV